VESLFTLLGLDFAKDGKKFQPFDRKFKMLGLEIDLNGSEDRNCDWAHRGTQK
jgi:hypothetical protein